MTYRQVPQRWRLAAQLATLATTSIIGASILVTPRLSDAKLTIIESTMTASPWAWTMIIAGALGFLVESYIAWRNIQPIFALRTVSVCHVISMSVMFGYSASAIASLIRTGHSYAFAGPVLGFYLMLMHYVYINRRYMDRRDMILAAIEHPDE